MKKNTGKFHPTQELLLSVILLQDEIGEAEISEKNLIKARKELKLTHYQIAKKAKISRYYYTMLENGTRTPSIEVASRLSTILKNSIENLFEIYGIMSIDVSEFLSLEPV